MPKSKGRFAVLTADIANSRAVKDFPAERDRRLRPIAKLHRASGLIVSDYAITAWDEFEGLLSDPVNISEVLLDLRRFFYPLRLRVGLGIGEVSLPLRKPINAFGGGSAFERAREAMERLKAERNTLARSTLIVSDKPEFDAIFNTTYQLHDALIERTSAKQWEAINVQLKSKSQDVTAARLGLDKSTVSRRLSRGYYAEMLSVRDTVKTIVTYFWNK